MIARARACIVACVVSLASALAVQPTTTLTAHADADSVCQRRRPQRPSRARARSRGRGQSRRRPRQPRRPAVSAAYIRTRTAWHRPAPQGVRTRWAAQALPPLVIKPVGGGGTFELVPDREGRFGTEALARAREAFTYRSDHASTDIHPRLLELAYRAVRNFDAPYVHLVSGYRTTRSTSRHNQGRAMDIVLPGVTDERLASYLRQQGFVGVGVYPTSGFVHLDVRARSYFWVDRSGPNQPSRAQGTLANLVSRFDAAARQRDEVPVADLVSEATDEEESAEEGGD